MSGDNKNEIIYTFKRVDGSTAILLKRDFLKNEAARLFPEKTKRANEMLRNAIWLDPRFKKPKFK